MCAMRLFLRDVSGAVLKRMSVSVSNHHLSVPAAAAAASASASVVGKRFFGDAAGLSKEEVTERVIQVVRNMDKVEDGKVTADAPCEFNKDLGLDSLDTVEVVMAFEEEFQLEIPDDDADKITSVQLAIDYVSKHPMAK